MHKNPLDLIGRVEKWNLNHFGWKQIHSFVDEDVFKVVPMLTFGMGIFFNKTPQNKNQPATTKKIQTLKPKNLKMYLYVTSLEIKALDI